MDIYEKTVRFYESVQTEKTIIGKSVLGRNMYAVKLGEGSPVGIAQYALHGREFITSELAFHQYGYGLKTGSFWLVLLANPDGALLSEVGVETAWARREKLLCLNKNSEDFSLWKANANGVDLNVNFPAKWGKGVKNTRVAGPENYIGAYPFCEPETKALRRFTQKIRPDYTVSYHTKGEEIYWYFHQPRETRPRDYALGKALSEATGYPLVKTKGSVGGYKDWCVSRFKIPSFTVEVGADSLSHPLGETALGDILQKNGDSLERLAKAWKKEYEKTYERRKIYARSDPLR